LLSAIDAPIVLASGLPRVRNFEANRFPFRAESHFLYFIGRHLQGALLCFDQGEAVLFAPEAPDEDALWHGAQPSLDMLSDELQLPVRPIGEFRAPDEALTLAPADTETGLWLEDLLGRDVEPALPEDLSEEDAELAEAMIALRLRHDEAALIQMGHAARVTSAAHLRAMNKTAPERREAFVRAELEAEFTSGGMVGAYSSIVSVHGEVLHHDSSFNWMKNGELLLVDAGAESAEGWASDVTRTWPVSGRFTTLQAEVYDLVLGAQKAAIASLEPGVRFRDVHRKAAAHLVSGLVDLGVLRGDPAELVADGAAALFFPHGLGHLLGLDVHDMEDLGDRAGYAPGRERSDQPGECYLRLDRDLQAGMVVTIEPGIYVIPSVLAQAPARLRDALQPERLAQLQAAVRGIRIEDDVLITDDGAEVLSASIPKERFEIEALVGRG
jgi:Xaa-Pro aminopeptidase